MTLESLDILELRAADGLASADELAQLRSAGRDPGGWPVVQPVLRAALAPPPMGAGFSAAVLGALGLEQAGVPLDVLRSERPAASPGLAPQVLRALGLSGHGFPLAAALHDAAGAPPSVCGPVGRVLGWDGLGLRVGPALRAAAGDGPGVEAGVMASVAPQAEVLPVGAALRRAAGTAPSLELELEGSQALLAAVLHAAAGPAPSLVAGVMSGLGLADGLPSLAGLRPAGPAPALSTGVLTGLELTDGAVPVAAAVRAEAGATPALAAPVLAQLDPAQAGSEVGAVLRRAAGRSPSLSDGVLHSLGLQERGLPDVAAAIREQAGEVGAVGAASSPDREGSPSKAAPVVPLRPAARLRRVPLWAAPAVAMAAAALLMVVGSFFGMSAIDLPDGPGPVPMLANSIVIEEISTDVDAIVSVVQSEDEDATPIIFIDVLEDDAPEGTVEEEGTTL